MKEAISTAAQNFSSTAGGASAGSGILIALQNNATLVGLSFTAATFAVYVVFKVLSHRLASRETEARIDSYLRGGRE